MLETLLRSEDDIMKGMLRFAMGALCALTIAGVYAGGPPGAAGLVSQDDDIEFDLNAGNLVTTGAISTTISLGNPAPVCLSKNLNTLDIDLNLAALTGIPGLPTITLTGTTNATGECHQLVGRYSGSEPLSKR
jgi:hypothetical protein